MQTRANLEKLTKEKVIDVTLEIQNKLEDLSNEPLSSASIVKRQLTLIAQSNEVDVTIAKIRSEAEIKIKRIEKEAELEQVEKLSAILGEYNTLKDAIKDVDTALKSSVATAEAEAGEKIAIITEKVAKADSDANEKIAAIKLRLSDHERIAVETVNSVKLDYQRQFEDLKFEQERALKQNNQGFVEKVAKSLDLVLVPVTELKELKDIKPLEEVAIQAQIEIAVKAAQSVLHAKYNGEIKDLKHASDLTIAGLNGNVHNLSIQLASATTREQALAEQVAKIPTVIKEAVQAAKSEITVNNEGTAKK